MAEEIRKFVDREGLNLYHKMLKDALTDASKRNFEVAADKDALGRVINETYLTDASLAEYLKKADADDLYVAQIEGYGLSKNDFSDELKAKLDGIEEGAEANVIESIKIDNVEQAIDGKVCTLNLSAYAKKEDIAKVLKFKGTVDYQKDLPTDASVGDIYIVKYKGTSGTTPWNCEFVFTDAPEPHWEELGGAIDLSNYYTKEEADSAITTAVNTEKTRALAAEEALDDKIDAAVEAAEIELDKKQDKLTAGAGIVINNNTITYNPDVLATVDYVDGSISDTILYIDQQDASEHAGRVAGDNLLQAAITAEETRAKEAEATLTGKVEVLEGDAHTHENKEVLDGITAAKVTAWDAEPTDREAADLVLEDKIADEAEARAADDSKEIVARQGAIDDAFETEIHVVADHDIKKMFGNTLDAGEFSSVAAAVTAADPGDVIEVLENGTTPMINATTGKDVSIALADGVTLSANAANVRVVQVGGDAVVEVAGGTITNSNSGSNPAFFVGDQGTLIVKDATITNTYAAKPFMETIMTNGSQRGSKIILENCTINGRMYFPAESEITINNCTITGRMGCINIRSGKLTVRNSEFFMEGSDADWAYYTNGAIFGQACIVAEAAEGGSTGYGKAPVLDIDKATIFHKAEPNIEGTATFDVLCINYGGKFLDNSKIACTHGYTDNITGHVFNGRTVPADGWCHWITEGEGKNVSIIER